MKGCDFSLSKLAYWKTKASVYELTRFQGDFFRKFGSALSSTDLHQRLQFRSDICVTQLRTRCEMWRFVICLRRSVFFVHMNWITFKIKISQVLYNAIAEIQFLNLTAMTETTGKP